MSYKISFAEFFNYVEEHLLEGWKENCEIEIRKIQKNNGHMFTGVILYKEGEDAAPTLYLEDAYEYYCLVENLDEALKWMRESYEYAEKSMEELYVDILDYQEMSEKIVYRLVNYEKNKDILEECPHILMHDLAVTFHCVISTNDIALSSTLIRNDLFEQWGITFDTLLQKASENTKRIFPVTFRSMKQCFVDEDTENIDFADLFVVSNGKMLHGAAVLLYEGVLEAFAEGIGSNYYILPSSIHELILVPEELVIDVRDLLGMVKEANECVVDDVDILSDSVYYYEKESGNLSVISSHF